MMTNTNKTAAAIVSSYSDLRSAWNESPSETNYHAMRAAYAAWRRAERAEDVKWDEHLRLRSAMAPAPR